MRADDPLVIATAGLLVQPAGTIREIAVDAVAVEPVDEIVAAPVSGTIRLTRTNRGLLVDAHLATSIAEACARCLRAITVPLELRIDEEVLPSIDHVSGLPVRPEEDMDPEVSRLDDHHELDLRPLVAAAISLAAPIAPVCEPDCLGLCPECGERRTAGHEHPSDEIDPRLEALRAFRVDEDPETG